MSNELIGEPTLDQRIQRLRQWVESGQDTAKIGRVGYLADLTHIAVAAQANRLQVDAPRVESAFGLIARELRIANLFTLLNNHDGLADLQERFSDRYCQAYGLDRAAGGYQERTSKCLGLPTERDDAPWRQAWAQGIKRLDNQLIEEYFHFALTLNPAQFMNQGQEGEADD